MKKKTITALAITTLLGACGGGSSDSELPGSNPDYKGGVHFGYFDSGIQIEEVSNHVSVTFEPQSLNYSQLFRGLHYSQDQGLKSIIAIGDRVYRGTYCRDDSVAMLDELFGQPKIKGLLYDTYTLYPPNEPDLNSTASEIDRCIKSNSLASAYCKAGRLLTQKPGVC